MNRLNITTLLCDRVSDNNIIGVFDSIEPKYNNGRVELSMSMLINIIAVFPKKDSRNDDKNKSIQKNTEYEVLIRLNYVQNGLGVDIDHFTFITSPSKRMCRDIFEMRRIIDIRNLELPNGIGDYGIKIFIKKKTDEVWSLQTIQGFRVGL